MMTINSHSQEHSEQLAKLDLARRELAEADSIQQIQSIRHQAESVRTHAVRASLGVSLQNLAAELKLQAERLGGQMLAEMKLRGGDRYSAPRPLNSLRLRDLGIDKNQSSRWQLEATVPEVTFRDFVRSAQANGREISSAALIRIAKQLRSTTHRRAHPDEERPALPISTKSHLITVDASTTEPFRRDVVAIADLVHEVQNHHVLLSNLVESICRRAAIETTCTDYRAAHRYLAEITVHLRTIATGLKRIRRETILFEPESRTASV
ncbi:MAG: hypothetical protein KDB23_06110 [Planctomycetales bacterium]|nr:hypothetical protein [Planctomycetales bacterium]